MKTLRIISAVLLAAAGLAVGTGIASAHVTVSATNAAAGSYSVLTFRVPNESDAAGTVKLDITIPESTPLASVRYQAVPGWTAKAVKSTLPTPVKQGDLELTEAITSVTFTADQGTSIMPGEFAEFDLSVGPLPDVAALSFPTTQTYDDGKVVKWADPVTEGAAEPEHPAPTLTLSGEATGGHHGGAEVSAAPASSAAPLASGPSVEQVATTATSDTTARVLSVIGLVVAAAAVLVAALALRRRPTSTRPTAAEPTGAGPDA